MPKKGEKMSEEHKAKLKQAHAKKKAEAKPELIKKVSFKKNYGFDHFIGQEVPAELLVEKREELKKRGII